MRLITSWPGQGLGAAWYLRESGIKFDEMGPPIAHQVCFHPVAPGVLQRPDTVVGRRARADGGGACWRDRMDRRRRANGRLGRRRIRIRLSARSPARDPHGLRRSVGDPQRPAV